MKEQREGEAKPKLSKKAEPFLKWAGGKSQLLEQYKEFIPRDFNNYIEERYKDQIIWYSNCATRNKRFYTFFQWGVIVLSASLPVLIASVPEEWQLATVILSILLAIGTSGLKTFKFQENWINYRTISETLKKEKHFYDADLNDYSEASDKEALFIDRVESLISRENTLWVTTHMGQTTYQAFYTSIAMDSTDKFHISYM